MPNRKRMIVALKGAISQVTSGRIREVILQDLGGD